MKRSFVSLLVVLLFSVFSVFSQKKVVPNLEKYVDKKAMERWVDSVFNTLTPDQRIGQLITVITTSENTPAKQKELLGNIQNQHIGGIIYLKGTPLSQASLTNYCQKNSKVPLLISIDGEWGLAMRLTNTTRFPVNMMLGAVQGDSLIYQYGLEVARQCKIMGIHINYAPDIDVNSNPSNPVIGTRSFGEDPALVSRLGRMYSKGLEDGGVMAVAKHFPGHGDTSTDSHFTLPLLEHDKERLKNVELVPFRDYINAGMSGMMIGHLNIPALDSSRVPSSLSKPIVTDLLQKELGFSGLVFSDGLAMKGVADEKDMSIRLLLAGNDVLLGPASPRKEFNAIKNAVASGVLSKDLINEKCKKVLRWKYILGATSKQQIETKNLTDSINSPHADWLNRKLNEKAITLLKNDDNIIPLKNLEKRKIAVVSIGDNKGNTFQRTLALYANVDQFGVQNSDALSSLELTLAKYNTVIIAVHNRKYYLSQSVQSICKGKNSILVFFTSPYNISQYNSAVATASGVVVGYEDTKYANEYAAQAIFGGNAIEGVLPVSVGNFFKAGDGIKTKKERLSYGIPEDVGLSSNQLAKIDGIINEGLTERAYPGCQVLIAKNGVVIYNESFGSFSYGSKKKVTNDDIYDLASMTKAVATLPAVMKLYDQKKITLQDKLSKYVPALKGNDKESITVRQALLHESGLVSFIPYYMPAIDETSFEGKLFNAKRTQLYDSEFDTNVWTRSDFKFKKNLISTTPKKGFDLQIADKLYANTAYKDTILEAIASSSLRASKSYLYSCLNFMLLKEAVENIGKDDLNSFLQNNFYEKLGSYTTTYQPLNKFEKNRIVPTEKDDFLRNQLLQGYVHDEGAAFMGGISGNAGLFSNANDLAKLCQMLLNKGEYGGERFLSQQACRAFTVTKSGTSRRGLGFDKPDVQNARVSPCSPSTPLSVYGHTGFTGTCFWIDPDNDMIFIFLSNRVNEKRSNKKLMSMNIRSRIQEQIYTAINPKKAEVIVSESKSLKVAKPKKATTAKKKTGSKIKARSKK